MGNGAMRDDTGVHPSRRDVRDVSAGDVIRDEDKWRHRRLQGWHKQPAGMGGQSKRWCRGGKELIAETRRHLVSERLGCEDITGIAGGRLESFCVDLIPSGVSCSAVRRRVRQVAGNVDCAPDSERVHAVSQRASNGPAHCTVTDRTKSHLLPTSASLINLRTFSTPLPPHRRHHPRSTAHSPQRHVVPKQNPADRQRAPNSPYGD